MGNQSLSDKDLARRAFESLERRLPSGWTIENTFSEPPNSPADALVSVTAPDGQIANLVVEAKRSLDPRGAKELGDRLRTRQRDEPFIVVSPYLSPGARERLTQADIGYVDLTGNARLFLRTPSLYVETTGANRDPAPSRRPTRSIRGPRAGRIIRTLCDFRDPGGVTELARTTGLDPGYVSRLLALLDRETLVERGARGRITKVDWERLLRRWAQDVPFEKRSETGSYLEPRGLAALMDRLPTSGLRYAITGSFAAARVAPIAPPRLAVIYVESRERAAETWKVRSAETGGNVLLTIPADEWAFQGSRQEDGADYAALSQVAADLLTSPGRGPAEGDELLSWMAANEEKWRG